MISKFFIERPVLANAVLLCLAAEQQPGRRALYELWEQVREGK